MRGHARDQRGNMLEVLPEGFGEHIRVVAWVDAQAAIGL